MYTTFLFLFSFVVFQLISKACSTYRPSSQVCNPSFELTSSHIQYDFGLSNRGPNAALDTKLHLNLLTPDSEDQTQQPKT